eukprot:14667779-Ditylum_brightwellii.AAC.1
MARDCATHRNFDTTTIIKNIWHREEVKTSFKIMQPIAKAFAQKQTSSQSSMGHSVRKGPSKKLYWRLWVGSRMSQYTGG